MCSLGLRNLVLVLLCYNLYTVYDKIFAGQKFRQAQLPLYCRGINFRQCGKGRHTLNVIINTGQKIRTIKISPVRTDGEIGENFLLAKTSAYIVQYMHACI